MHLALAAVALLAGSALLFAQGHTGTTSLAVGVNPEDSLTITGGNTVSLKIRLGTGPAYLWGDSSSDCTSPIGTATTISTSGTYTPALTAVPFNPTSNDYVCVYSSSTPSLNKSVAWPHTGLALVFNGEPSNTAAGASISPAVTVQVKDSNGILVASSTASVTLAITSGTPATGGPGTLSGTLTQSAVNGTATFNNLSINTDGTNYKLHATSGSLTAADSTTFNISSGTATQVRVETAANGSGTVVPTQSIASGSTLTVYAISRDASNNFVANVTATWSLVSITGGVVSGDLSPASGTSATFTGHVIGTAAIHTVSGSLTSTNSGTITVTAGTATQVRVETAADGSGTVVPAQNVASGSTLTVYAISRDANGNFVANVTATWSLQSITGGVVSGDLSPTSGTSSTFTGHVIGTATIHAVVGSFTGNSGTITVTPGALASFTLALASPQTNGVAFIGTNTLTARDGSGNTITTFNASTNNVTITANSPLTGTVSGIHGSNVLNGSGDFTNGVANLTTLGMTYTGNATAGTFAATSGGKTGTSGSVVINGGTATQVRVETAADGSGTVVPTQNVASGSTLTVYAISRDASNNFVANVTATWSLVNLTGGVVSGDLSPTSGTSATFTGHVIGTAAIHAVSGSLTLTNSGTITVTAGTATQVRVEMAANGSGTVVPTQNVASGSTLTVYAISRDASNNFVANVTATWSLVSVTGGVVSGDLSTASGTSTTFTGHVIGTAAIHAVSGSLTSTDSGTITVTPGTANKLAFTTQPSGGSTGTVWTIQPVVTLQDSSGNTVTGTAQNVTLAIQNNPGSGTLSGTKTVAVNTSTGQASFSGSSLSINNAGTGYTLTATGNTVSTTAGVVVSNAFNIVNAGSTSLNAPGVGAQTPNPVPAGSAATYGGINGITVTIGAAGPCTAALSIANLTGGASGSFSPSQLVFTTQTSLTSTLTVTTTPTTPVGTQSGINISATGSDGCSGTHTTTTTFVVSAGPVTAGNSTVSASPTSVVADGATLSTITVTLKDANNNPVSGKTVTLAQGGGSSTISAASGLSNSSGVVTFTVKDSKAEAVTYTATDTTDSVPITQTATVTFTASKLAITSVNGGANPTAGTAFSVVVQAQDANGNPANVVNSTGVTLSLNTGTGTLGGTLTGTITAGSNSVTISGVTYTKAQSGVILTATRTSGDSLTAGNSAAFTVNPGAINSFSISAISSPQTVGTAFNITTITALDANNNTVTGFTSTVTYGGTAGVTGTSPAFTAGVLSNGSVTPMVSGSSLTVTVNDGSGHTGSATITTVNPGPAAKFVITGSGTQTAGGSQTIAIKAQDVGGNTATSYTGSHNLTFSGASPSTNPVTNPTVTNNSAGAITFGSSTNIQFSLGVLVGAGGGMVLYDAQTATISVTDGTISSSGAGNLTVVVSAATANKLAFTTQPGGGTGGAAWMTQPVVTVLDAYGNTANSSASVTLAIGTNPGGGTLACTGGLSKSASSGVATFAGCNITLVGTGYTLTATSSGLTSATSSAFNITVGSASKLVWGQQPPATLAKNTVINPAMTVFVEDAGGNLVNSTASVTLAYTVTGNDAISGTNPVNAVGGTATFSNIEITGNQSHSSSPFTASSGGLTSVNSNNFDFTD